MENSEIFIDECVRKFFESSDVNANHKIQRYMKLDRFFKSLERNTLTFQEPKSWDDPFEDFISKLKNCRPNAQFNSFNICEGTYAQCWISKNIECDGMWRNYATLDKGIQIHTTFGKVIKSLFKWLLNNKNFEDKSIFENELDIQRSLCYSIEIRKINYVSDKDIANKFIVKTSTIDLDFDQVRYNLLSMKRNEFSYENEYRIFIETIALKLPSDKFLEIGYLKDIIDKITFSPMVNDIILSLNKQRLIEEHHFSSNIIEKSSLYDFHSFKKRYNL